MPNGQYLFIIKFILFNDFYIYLIASRLFWTGFFPYGITNDFINLKTFFGLNFHWATGYSYPPLLLALLWPFQFFSPQTSAVIWLFLSLSLYLIFVAKSSHKLFSLTFLPALMTLATGQINIFILWLIIFYLRSPSPVISGISLGIASAFKVYPLLLLPLNLIKKEYLKVFSAVATFILLQLPFFKLSVFYFLYFLPGLNSKFETYPHLQSLNSVITRIVGSLPAATYLNLSVTIIILSLLFIYSLKNSAKTHLPYLWLLVITLLPGHNSFLNFLPCILVFHYLLDNQKSLSRFQKFCLFISVSVTNLFFPLAFYFPALSSLGFMAFVLAGFILLGLKKL
jgi:hypothetical protein